MTNKEIVEKFAQAYDNFDIKECCKYIHAEVKVRSLTSNTYSVDGIEKFAEFYSAAFQKYHHQKLSY